MAITPAQCQTALGDTIGDAKILIARESVGTLQEWYVQGRLAVPGRCRWVTTTAADNAATQAAAILTGLRA